MSRHKEWTRASTFLPQVHVRRLPSRAVESRARTEPDHPAVWGRRGVNRSKRKAASHGMNHVSCVFCHVRS